MFVRVFPQCHGSRTHGAVDIQVLRNRVFRLTGWRTLAPISQRILGTVFGGFPLEQRSDPARRNLQHRKARAARAQPGRGPDRHAPAGFSPLARRAPAQQRERHCWPPIARSRAPWTKAAPSRPPPNGCSTTTTWSRSRSAKSARTCRRASTASFPNSPRDRSRVSRACSASPGRSSRTPTAASIRNSCGASCAPTRRCAAHHRRVVGGGDHAAHRAGRKPAPRRASHRQQPRIAPGRRRDRRPAVGRQRPARRRQCAQRLETPRRETDARVRRAAGASAARPGPEVHARAGLARRRIARGRPRHRPRDPGRAPAPGRVQRHGAQHHHQHAADVGRRLGRVLREREPGRRDHAGLQRLLGDGLRHAQSLPQRHRKAGSRLDAVGAGDRAARAGTGERRPGAPRARSRVLPDRRGAAAPRARHRLPRAPARLAGPHHLHRGCGRLRRGHRVHHRPAARGAARAAAAVRRARRHVVVVRPAGRGHGHGGRRGAGQPRGHARPRREPPAGPRAARRGARGTAHAGGHAGAAELACRGRGTSAPARDPLSRLARRPTALRVALRLGGREQRAPARRRCVTRHRRARHRAAQPEVRHSRPAANASCCCIAAECGARANSAGWDGNASAANSRS